MTQATASQAPVIYGDGHQSRDFVYVKDVVSANLLAATVNQPQGAVFNVGTGDQVSINRLWGLIASMSAANLPDPRYETARAGDIRHSRAGLAYSKSNLEFKPEFSFEQGLAATFEWYQERMTEDRRQKTEDRRQKTEDRRRKTEDG